MHRLIINLMRQGAEMSANRPTTVFIVEDHELMRDGLRAVLERDGKFTVIGAAGDGLTAVHQVQQVRPVVVIMDIGLPHLDGIEAAKRVKELVPETKVIILTSHDSEVEIFAALSAGAAGYCLKDTVREKLKLAISSVADGAIWIDPRIAAKVLGTFQAATGSPARPVGAAKLADQTPLSQMERAVLQLMVEGLSNKEIAERLTIGVATVHTHVEQILEKLAGSGPTKAAVKAMKQRLV